ncbi:uncharacterized protein LOC135116761 [Helicoverpa armigera]|uniref:uncharacterized protein LOC135116761 n=1 Tax=Helicoverpa armigera TaxID=29058 RepID=UPI00308323CA
MSSDSESSSTPPRKIKKKGGWTSKKEGNTIFQHHSQTFRNEWLKNPIFRDWLQPDLKNPKKAKCAYCPSSSLVAEITNLKSHAESKKHLRNKPGSSGLQSQKLTSFGFKTGITQINKQKDRAEIKLAAFFAEHNIAFSVADHLTDLLKEIIPDSTLVQEIQLKRTKITAVVKNAIGEGHKVDLANKLKLTKFSALTDETTDVSTVKTACVVVRYFDHDAQKICSAFWELYKIFKETDTNDIPTANAENLYRALIDSFTSRNVPLTNMIGFGSDGCNVMMGDNDSVKTRLTRDLPGIVISKCVCHSAHLCASQACKEIPESVEQLARDIYNFFKNSDKRQFDFRNFQSFVEVEPHKILKPSQTRWLSLTAVVSRILEQWEALRLFFIDFTTNPIHKVKAEVKNRAIFILEKLCDPFHKLYFCFLDWSLPLFTKFNLEFQNEKVVIHKLHDKIRDFYQEILLRYLQREYVMRQNISDVDPNNEQFLLNDAVMYLGIKVYEMLKHPDVVRQPAKKALFFTSCRNFLRTSALEIKKRYDMEDPVLSKLQALGPVSALSNNFRDLVPTLMPLMEVVPRISASFNDSQKQEIDDQWRRLPIAKARYPEQLQDTKEPDEFWAMLVKNDHFSELASFALAVLSLPHANADCNISTYTA